MFYLFNFIFSPFSTAFISYFPNFSYLLINSNLTDAYFESLYSIIFSYNGLSLILPLILLPSTTRFPIQLSSSINTSNLLIFQPYKLKNFFFHFSLCTIIPYIFNPTPILYELFHYILELIKL